MKRKDKIVMFINICIQILGLSKIKLKSVLFCHIRMVFQVILCMHAIFCIYCNLVHIR